MILIVFIFPHSIRRSLIQDWHRSTTDPNGSIYFRSAENYNISSVSTSSSLSTPNIHARRRRRDEALRTTTTAVGAEGKHRNELFARELPLPTSIKSEIVTTRRRPTSTRLDRLIFTSGESPRRLFFFVLALSLPECAKNENYRQVKFM